MSIEQAAHLRELAVRITHAEQHERDHLSALLHDDVQPQLVAARLLLSSLDAKTAPDECLRLASMACAHISQVILTARTLSYQLSPPLVIERSLKLALESLLRWVRLNFRLEVDLLSAPDAEPGSLALRMLCFNAVRELLMNVAKHAGTTQATVTLQRLAGDLLRIDVADGGHGFNTDGLVTDGLDMDGLDTDGLDTDGSGLALIQRRAGIFSGSLQIISQPGHGTIATLLLPLRLTRASAPLRRKQQENTRAQNTDRR